MPSGLPAGGRKIIGPRVGRVGLVCVDLLPRILRRILTVTAAGEEILGPVGVGGDPDRLALAHRVRVFVPFVSQRLGNGVDKGEEHGHVAAGATSDEGAKSVTGLGGFDVPLSSGLRLPLPVRRRVDLQQRGVEDLDETRPGDQLDLVVQQLVDDPGREDGEMRRRAGDLASLPGIDVAGEDPFPEARQAVPHGQGVRDPALGRLGGGAKGQREAAGAGFGDRWAAGRSEGQQSFHQHAAVGMIHVGVSIGPGGGDSELATAELPHLVLGLGGQIGEGSRVAECALQPIFEHVCDSINGSMLSPENATVNIVVWWESSGLPPVGTMQGMTTQAAWIGAITIDCEDSESMRRFYRDALGGVDMPGHSSRCGSRGCPQLPRARRLGAPDLARR